LGVACDEALQQTGFSSPDALDANMAPCMAALSWIDCQSSDATLCPGPTDSQLWLTRYAKVFSAYQSLNGQLQLDLVTVGPAKLQATQSAAQTVASQGLSQALSQAQPPLDFTIASYCANYGLASYNGTSIVDYVQSYARVPGYGIQGTSILVTLLALYEANAISQADTIALMQTMAGDDQVELGTKLYVEQLLFQSGVID
jgi:hypothetical protein